VTNEMAFQASGARVHTAEAAQSMSARLGDFRSARSPARHDIGPMRSTSPAHPRNSPIGLGARKKSLSEVLWKTLCGMYCEAPRARAAPNP